MPAPVHVVRREKLAKEMDEALPGTGRRQLRALRDGREHSVAMMG